MQYEYSGVERALPSAADRRRRHPKRSACDRACSQPCRVVSVGQYSRVRVSVCLGVFVGGSCVRNCATVTSVLSDLYQCRGLVKVVSESGVNIVVAVCAF